MTTLAIGRHNADLDATRQRLERGQSYRDLSTVWVTPTRGGRSLHHKAVSAWMGLIRPMNQQVFGPLFIAGDEVGQAYANAVDAILANPVLRKAKYLLTVEDDNLPPPDGLLKLYESIEGKVDGQKYDVVGGLYFTKGEGGQPMAYGHPLDMPKNFRPWLPPANTVARCNGLGMGFNLFRMKLFTDGKLQKPWFQTVQDYTPGVGSKGFTQDLDFFNRASEIGARFACDTRVLVGHLDPDTGDVW